MSFLQEYACHSRLFSNRPALTHGFFGRRGGVSSGVFASLNAGLNSGDKASCLTLNREKIRGALDAKALVSVNQVHGAQVVYVNSQLDENNLPDADAMVTDKSAVALGVLTADCAPVLYYAQDINWIGAAHSGWGGAFKGVNEALVDALLLQGAALDNIYVAIGPTISQDAYEVDAEFRVRLIEGSAVDATSCFIKGARDGHYQFDLPGYIKLRLNAKGLLHIDDLAIDTYKNTEQYFSYRRSTHEKQTQYGRQISAIMLR